jgi:hypothetical protein
MTQSDKQTKPNSAISKVIGQYKEKIGGKLFKYHVKEWDLDIYYRAISNMYVEQEIMSLQQMGKTSEALIQSIILKAVDVDGNRLFSKMDKEELMREADPAVIIRVATKLNNAIDMPKEDIEGN